ncbi:peptidoglycan DD-metalloendopeptidase family protein [uncultured Arthrobacter sp.]|uniref:M23 family metallopeptidase n=1 Tax=uncultured Arthrobacter sp. TaxID=114050 RepID=UPI0032175A24
MRPVDSKFKDTQQFGSGATQGVKANSNPNSGMGYYVWLYGNYQPLGHAGLDIGCPIGTPIYAPADGTVLYAGWVEDLPGNGPVRKWLLYYNFGGIVTVTQHTGWISIIAHQSNNDYVKAGQRITEGQLIGLSGNTMTRKTTLAPHVHVEALVDLTYRSTGGLIYGRTDPQKFFNSGISAQGSTTTTTTSKEWDDMASIEEFKQAVREVAKEGPAGRDLAWFTWREHLLPGWNGDVSAAARIAGTDQAVNDIRAQLGALHGQVVGLVGALASVTKGEPFDEAKLLAGVQAAAESGVKDAIESITVTVKEGK